MVVYSCSAAAAAATAAVVTAASAAASITPVCPTWCDHLASHGQRRAPARVHSRPRRISRPRPYTLQPVQCLLRCWSSLVSLLLLLSCVCRCRCGQHHPRNLALYWYGSLGGLQSVLWWTRGAVIAFGWALTIVLFVTRRAQIGRKDFCYAPGEEPNAKCFLVVIFLEKKSVSKEPEVLQYCYKGSDPRAAYTARYARDGRIIRTSTTNKCEGGRKERPMIWCNCTGWFKLKGGNDLPHECRSNNLVSPSQEGA